MAACGALAILLCGTCSGAWIAIDLSDPCWGGRGSAECADSYPGVITTFALYLGVAPVLFGGSLLAVGLQRLRLLSQRTLALVVLSSGLLIVVVYALGAAARWRWSPTPGRTRSTPSRSSRHRLS